MHSINKRFFLCVYLISFYNPCVAQPDQTRAPLKPYTFMVYMAGRNNLAGFAPRNIKQMAAIGSNENVNVVVHLDIKLSNGTPTTRRYYIEPNKVIHMNANDPATQFMDSGDPNTVISFFNWAVENYPAQKYVFLFWNHGLGIIDPQNGKIVNTSELFVFNPFNNKLELDRTVDFLDLVESPLIDPKGVCWDEVKNNYLTNQKLEFALKIMSQKIGRKLDMVIFDACLMSMLEIGNIVRKYAHLMMASQEVVLGPGYNYSQLLEIFKSQNPSLPDFAQHIVKTYEQTYNKVTNDYTQAAINLDELELLEQNVNSVAPLLIECLRIQASNSVKQSLSYARNPSNCTHFDIASYLDLHHFYTLLKSQLPKFQFTDPALGNQLVAQLDPLLNQGCELIKKIVIQNAVGQNLAKAHGLSIYFPERKIHPSYKISEFGKHNQWGTFLTRFILG
jgi:hypothetical protein